MWLLVLFFIQLALDSSLATQCSDAWASGLDDWPTSTFVDGQENLYVAEMHQKHVKKLDGQGVASVAITDTNKILSVFITKAGTTYIAVLEESSNSCKVIKLPAGGTSGTQGTVVAGGNGQGNALNQLTTYTPSIVVDEQDNVYVADFSNHRVVMWAPSATEGIVVAGNGQQTDNLDTVTPETIKFDWEQQNLFIAEARNNRILKWRPGARCGTQVAGGSTSGGSALNELKGPSFFVVDACDTLYILEGGNHRVTRWEAGACAGTLVAETGGDVWYKDLEIDCNGAVYVLGRNSQNGTFLTKCVGLAPNFSCDRSACPPVTATSCPTMAMPQDDPVRCLDTTTTTSSATATATTTTTASGTTSSTLSSTGTSTGTVTVTSTTGTSRSSTSTNSDTTTASTTSTMTSSTSTNSDTMTASTTSTMTSSTSTNSDTITGSTTSTLTSRSSTSTNSDTTSSSVTSTLTSLSSTSTSSEAMLSSTTSTLTSDTRVASSVATTGNAMRTGIGTSAASTATTILTSIGNAEKSSTNAGLADSVSTSSRGTTALPSDAASSNGDTMTSAATTTLTITASTESSIAATSVVAAVTSARSVGMSTTPVVLASTSTSSRGGTSTQPATGSIADTMTSLTSATATNTASVISSSATASVVAAIVTSEMSTSTATSTVQTGASSGRTTTADMHASAAATSSSGPPASSSTEVPSVFPPGTMSSTATSNDGTEGYSINAVEGIAATTQGGTTQAWLVHVVLQLEGLTVAITTSEQASAALVQAIKGSVITVIESKLGVSFAHSALRAQLPGGRRLQEAASPGAEVKVGIAPGTSMSASQLFEGLESAKSELMATMQERFEAVPELAEVSPIGLKIVYAEKPQLQNVVDSAVSALLSKITAGEDTVTMDLDDGGTVTVTKVSELLESDQLDRAVVEFPDVQVSLPTRELRALLSPREPLLLTVATAGRGEASGAVRAGVAIGLVAPNGTEVPVRGLTTPLEFSLKANYTQGLACEYWDRKAEQWSGYGVSLKRWSLLEERVWCVTNHLTVFGLLARGFLESILCSQLRLLNAEALSQLLEPAWLLGPGPVFYICFLALALLSIAVAIRADLAHSSMNWTMEDFFLIPAAEPEPPVEGRSSFAEKLSEVAGKMSDAMREEPRRHGLVVLALGLSSCICGFWSWCKENALRDALDEIMSNYVEQFSEIREFVQDICAEIEPYVYGRELLCAAASAGRCTQLLVKMMSKLVIASSKRMAAIRLGLSVDTIDFVLEDDDLKQLLVDRINDGVDIAPSRSEWYSCFTPKAAWARLHADVGDAMLVAVDVHRCGVCTVFQMFVANSALGLLYTYDIFMSCRMRVFFHLMEILGSLVISAIFFSASGSMQTKRNRSAASALSCGDSENQDDFFYKVGSSMAVAIGSILVSGLPVAFLESFHTRRIRTLDFQGAARKKQLKAWRAQDKIIWVFGCCYMLVGSAFIALLFANISEDDQQKWVLTAVMSVVWAEVVLPFALAATFPLVAEAAFLVAGLCARSTRAKMKRVAEKHLLDNSNLILPKMSL